MKKKRGKKSNHFFRYSFHVFAVFVMVGLLYPLVSKYYPTPCANSLSCEESLKLKIENNAVGVFENQPVMAPNIDLSRDIGRESVLGESNATGEKHIYVNLTTQTLSAYQGDTLFMQTPISSGLWGRTPTGEFTIWIKLRSTRMSGGSGADYYNLPNVPYVMFFSNDKVPASRGFSLHGTYWHNNFGHRMSHGCVNMKTTDVAKLYDWANPTTNGTITRASKNAPGTKVTIYEES